MRLSVTKKDALIVVDMQNDFMPGGALGIDGADRIVERINDYVRLFEKLSQPVYFTRDWHPKNHISFKENGGVWPRHCVQKSEGAKFHKDLYIPSDNRFVISKGTFEDFDAYSAFQGTELKSLLGERAIRRVFICGVATDYCVKHTLLGAINLGFETSFLYDAVKGVELHEGDCAAAVQEMLEAGTLLCEIDDFIDRRV